MKYLSTYKIINIAMLALVIGITLYARYQMGLPCEGDMECRYQFKRGLLQPLYAGGNILIFILIGLLLTSADIFRRWLFYLLPFGLLVTMYFVTDISVYSSGAFHIPRPRMAEICMYAFGVVTVLFVIVWLAVDWWKKRTSPYESK